MSNKAIHTFELSGLGKAPFHMVTNANGNTAFFCQHCGKMIKNRFFVKSSDGIVSVVGVDCVKNTDDNGLIAGVKRIQQEAKTKARMEKQDQARKLTQEKERSAFSGKTRAELLDELNQSLIAEQDALECFVYDLELTYPLTRSDFGMSIVSKLSEGESVSANVKRILTEIIAKRRSKARKNSNAYKEAYEKAELDINEYLKEISDKSKSLNDIKNKIIEVQNTVLNQ